MKRAKLKIHHLIAANIVRRYGHGMGIADLLHVKYDHGRPPDEEYPVLIGNLELYTRIFVSQAGKATFIIRMRHLDSDDAGKRYGLFRVVFTDALPVADVTFKLRRVHAPRPGRYVLELCRRTRGGWTGEEWMAIAREYIVVETRS